MCPRREATDRVDQANAFGGLEAETLEVGWTAVPDEAVEGLVDGLDVTGFEQRLGDVRSAHAAFAGDLVHPLQGDRRTDAHERRDHLLSAF